jgi:hypothetical protein
MIPSRNSPKNRVAQHLKRRRQKLVLLNEVEAAKIRAYTLEHSIGFGPLVRSRLADILSQDRQKT